MIPGRARLLGVLLLVLPLPHCDGPSVPVPLKPRQALPAAGDTDDLDDEAEERTRYMACTVDADCPGTENPICSPTLGCVECLSDADCSAGELCIAFLGDCEDPPKRP